MILDTNAYSAYLLNKRAVVDVLESATSVNLPLPVIAELRFGFANGSQADRNEAILEDFLSQPQVSIILPTVETTKHYARLQSHCKQHGRALSNNDLWIAALARENDGKLITFDRDFDVFQDIFGDKLLILTDN